MRKLWFILVNSETDKQHRDERRTKVKIYRMQEVATMLGLSKATVYKLIAAGEFPRGVKLGPRARGWTEKEIREWIESRSLNLGKEK